MKEPAPRVSSEKFSRGDKLWWDGGGFGYKDRVPVMAWGPAGAKSFRVLVVNADDGSSMYRMARLSRLSRRFECELPDSASTNEEKT